ncbi:MAG TPA: HAMP domain-containing sensor histidine kinase [Oculatellaceae cyanobacterium]
MALESRKWKSNRRSGETEQTGGETSMRAQPGVESPASGAQRGLVHDEARRDTNDWIAEVSHELRLPIANLKLLVETLLDGALEDEVTAKRMLTRAKSEVDRLQSLVVNLLSVERVASTRKDVHRIWVPFSSRVDYALETVRKLASEKEIDIRTQIAPDHNVYANPEMFDQILLNLLENAVKFTPSGGSVTIISGGQPGQFSVTDTGIGIASHEIPKIFQRFYRVDRAQSRGSTGLGLSIVKHIVELHGAKINVKSEEGKGSTFELTFPGPA